MHSAAHPHIDTQRAPSDRHALWAWWRAHQGSAPHTIPNEPQCGLYKVKARSGAWVAGAIDVLQDIDPETNELMDDEKLVAFVNYGRNQWDRDPHAAWPFMAQHPLTERDHTRLLHAPQVTDLSRQVIT
jgi:hypothetical protein